MTAYLRHSHYAVSVLRGGCRRCNRLLFTMSRTQSHSSYSSSDFTGGNFTSGIDMGASITSIGKAGFLGRGITPRALKQYLDAYIIGQSRPKRILSVAVYNHYQRIQSLKRKHDEEEELLRTA